MTRIVRRLAAALVLAAGATASAQTPQAPAEPSTPPRLQLGPLAVRPTLILRDVGYDSNVLNESGEGEGDFTATLGARMDLGIRAARVQGTYTSFYEYQYFQSFESERGSNRGAEGRVDLLLGRLRPYVTGGINRSHDRPNAEIDVRASRLQSSVGFGASVAAYSRTKLFAGYRQTGVDYAEGEQFRGVRLADELNGTGDAITVGGDIELSPLTTLSVHGERAQERFDTSLDRDADSYRYGATATFHPLALISGRASVGIRAFRPLGSALPDFTGLTAAIAVAYAFQDRTRVGLTVDRDLRYSFTERTPYYVTTGGRLTLTHRLYGNVDGQMIAGVERLAYEARLDVEGARDERDNVRTVGAGLGYRLTDGSRVGLNFDYATRTSPAEEREYSRGRLYGTFTYGF